MIVEMGKNNMNITILGSGTGTPSLRRSSCSALVETEKCRIVFDIGPGTIRRLLECGLRINCVTHVVLTHFHPDHCSELVPFLFALKSPEFSKEGRQLKLIGGDGLKVMFQGLKNVFGHWIELNPEYLEIIELNVMAEDCFVLEDGVLKSIPVLHNRESLAYRLEVDSHSLVVSGDTDTCENLVHISRNADMLLCESSTPDEIKREGHLTPSLAGRIASEACVKKLVLTHFYPECDKTDIAKQCFKTYDGPLFLAEDRMRFYL
jgi:ribonuclease BN (tRNA processing enzyme)